MIEVVTIHCPLGQSWQFDDVTKWHVDDTGHLHLKYPDNSAKSGNAASFAPGEWLSVVDASTDPTATDSSAAVGSIRPARAVQG